MNINKYIWRTGVFWRNPSLIGIYEGLKQNERASLSELKEMQFKRLNELLIFAYRYSDFYKKHFDKVAFSPEHIEVFPDDLLKIPKLEKSDILKTNLEVSKQVRYGKVFLSSTSGTSGQVLNFYRDEYWDSFHRASILRGYSWYGVDAWQRNGYLWGYNFSPSRRIKIGMEDALQNRFRLFSYREDDIIRFVNKLKGATFLSGYSSMIYEIARVINKHCIDTSQIRLKLVKGTSEKIFDAYQPEVKKAFGKKIVSEYGAAETGIIAFECPKGNMHINMEGVIVEEEKGEILVTNLVSRSFPIIRYKLGDYIQLMPDTFKCPCGMEHRVLAEVTGRVGKKIYGRDKTFPSLVCYNIFKNIAKNHGKHLNFQFEQREKGMLIIRIGQSKDQHTANIIRNESKKYFGNDLTIEISDDIPVHNRDGKLNDFISYLE